MAQEKWLIDDQKVIDFETVHSLKVGLVGGQVDIVGHDEPGARVEVHSVDGKPLKVSIEGGRLEIDHPQLSWENWIDAFSSFKSNIRADVSIMVPRAVALTLGVVSASGLVAGLTSDATISTVSGDLQLDGMIGDVQLNAVSGELSVRGHQGNVTARTVSGDVTASGEIPRFRSDGVSGDVFIDIAGLPEEAHVNTVSGNITARLASGVAARYRINTVSGKLQLDDQEITGVRGSYTGKYGTLENAWLELSANTVSGRISVLHAVNA